MLRPYVNAVPLVDIYAAAGSFSEEQISNEDFEWVELPMNISAKGGILRLSDNWRIYE